jgi:hypothetical protein
VEHRGFRGVQVFGSAAEGNDTAPAVADREHHAVAEAVVAFAGFGVLDQQAGIDHRFLLQGVAASA